MNIHKALLLALASITTPVAAASSADINGGKVILFFNGIQTTLFRKATDLYDRVVNPLLLEDAILQEYIPLLHKEIEASLAKNNSAAPRAELVRDQLFTNHDDIKKNGYSFKYNVDEPGIITITTTIEYENAKQLDPDYALESEKNQLKYIASLAHAHFPRKDKDLTLRYTLLITKKDFFDRYHAYDKQQQELIKQKHKADNNVSATSTAPLLGTTSTSSSKPDQAIVRDIGK